MLGKLTKNMDSLKMIFLRAFEINAQYKLTYEDGYAPNDILVAYETNLR